MEQKQAAESDFLIKNNTKLEELVINVEHYAAFKENDDNQKLVPCDLHLKCQSNQNSL